MAADDDDTGGPELRRVHTMSSSSIRPRTVPLGIETQRQKNELETALFGEPATPIEIAHYTVIGTLGSGGMGVVYVAHDQQLGRRVALKLLRHATASEVARARLQREAQAMARLSHPNVVTVHEVGTFRGQVFLAMEFVGGANLRAWLHMRKRSWRETVATFLQAGEGLAAAHDAGIIHRDFKPDNVLVGDDGRVRVADFGLAHGLDLMDVGEPTPSSHDSSVGKQGIPLDSPLTETGTIVGTPAYMAPEQHESSAKIDARCDQFAFCVALWEALYGKRPFPGAGLVELRLALKDNRIQHPADPSDVPAWLHRVILRGLSIDPSNRWPSMRELLVALARDPERVRRRRLRIAALAITTLTIIVSLSVRAATESRHNARQRYWNALTEDLLDIERERGLRQANDDASRARNATRMSSYLRYRPNEGRIEHEDPTMAAVLLREVEGEGRRSQDWISAANEILGQPISYAVLDAHRTVIVDIAFAPDSSAVYTASNDNEVRRWELATGVGRPIITHAREVVAVAVSPDGRVASGSKDGTARLWSSDSPDTSRMIAAHDSELTDVAFSPSGDMLATASRDGAVKLVSLSHEITRTLAGHTGPVHTLSFSPDGAQLLTAGDDHSARLWRVADGTQIAAFVGHDKAVFHAQFLDETRIVTGSDDGGVRLWHVRRPDAPELLTRHATAITALDVHRDRVASASSNHDMRIVELVERTMIELDPPAAVWSLAFVADGEQLVTGSFDGSAQLWSRHGGGPLRTFVGHREAVIRVATDPGGRWLATGSYDTDLRLWDLRRPGLRDTLEGHTRQISDIVFDAAERMIATASHDGSIRLWSSADARELGTLQIGDDAIYSVAFSPDAAYLAAGTHSRGVALWRLDDQSLRTLEGHERDVWQVAFDSTGQRLASASLDGTVRVWSVVDAREQLVLRGHTDMVTSVQFGPGDRRIISAANDGTIRIWDAESGASVATWQAHEGKIWRLVRSPDGHTLATVSDDGTAKLWPDDDPAHATELRGHRQPVWSVAFDPGGSRVVTASFDKDAKIWSTSDGSLLRTLTGHSETVWGARFTADGRVVTASEDNTLRVWPRDLGAPVIVLSGHVDAVTALALNRDGTRLISGSADATAKIWQLDRLLTEVEPLHQRLREATIWCLSVDRRIRELGEEEVEATQAFVACEAAYGRRADATTEQPR